MSPTKMEAEFNTIEDAETQRRRAEDKAKADKIRETYPTYKSFLEGGRSYAGITHAIVTFANNEAHSWAKLALDGPEYVCVVCGRVHVELWGPIGYMNPNKESLSALSNKSCAEE